MNTQTLMFPTSAFTGSAEARDLAAPFAYGNWVAPVECANIREEELSKIARKMIERHEGKVVVTIDGPASSGKSTQAENLARRLGLTYLDSGSLYRCIALACIRQGVPMEDAGAVTNMAESLGRGITFGWRSHDIGKSRQHTFLNGEDVTARIREDDISAGARKVSSHQSVRDVLTILQREIGRDGCVTAGRAQGTEVFPDATLKLFLTASLEERARRRTAEQFGISQQVVDTNGEIYRRVFEDLRARDEGDSNRKVGKLEMAADMLELDSTHLAQGEVLDQLTREVLQALNGPSIPTLRLPNQMNFPLLAFPNVAATN